jgi:ribonuclease HI
MKENTIVVFTDGSSRGNPGPGGWGAVVIDTLGKVYELGGREDHTTNNRMEIAAALGALAHIESRKLTGEIEINTDSAYLIQGITMWVFGWEKNGWKTKTGDDVLNQDLWKELYATTYRLKHKQPIAWNKVGGHIGLLGNERADLIATNAADKTQQLLYVGPLSQYEELIGGSVFSGTADEKVAAKKKKSSSKAGPAYSYVSMLDGKIQTHKTWAECEKRVKGKSGTKFKKAFSKAEEDSLKKEWSTSARKN